MALYSGSRNGIQVSLLQVLQRHLCASTALMFVDGMKHRIYEGMESKLLRSTHRTSPRAVKHGETMWYPWRNSHRGTASFLHHLVTFNCNCKPKSDGWARASDRAQSKGQESDTWHKLLQDKLRSKLPGNGSFISLNAHHQLLFTTVLIRWLGILPCCRSGLHYWQQYFSGATSTAAFLYLQLVSMLRQVALCGTTSPAVVSWQGQPGFSGNS